jgi:hypothetical protein
LIDINGQRVRITGQLVRILIIAIFVRTGHRTRPPRRYPPGTLGAGPVPDPDSAGYDHVLALRSNGTVLAWGGNAQGQLGDGAAGGTSGPVQVAGLTGASQVSAGAQFSLAVVLAGPSFI